MIPAFDAAILDMDGTITDTMPLWARVAPAICRRYRLDLPRQRVEEIIREMYFRSLTQSAQWFIDTYHLAAEPQEIVDLAWQVMAQAYRESARLKPGAARYLEQAHRRGMPLWVATASGKALAQEVLDRLGVLRYLEGILTCEELGTDKNHPDIFLEAARRMGTPPQRTAVFEDSPHSLETARRAGFVTIGFAEPVWAFAEERMRAACHRYVAGFEELLAQ